MRSGPMRELVFGIAECQWADVAARECFLLVRAGWIGTPFADDAEIAGVVALGCSAAGGTVVDTADASGDCEAAVTAAYVECVREAGAFLDSPASRPTPTTHRAGRSVPSIAPRRNSNGRRFLGGALGSSRGGFLDSALVGTTTGSESSWGGVAVIPPTRMARSVGASLPLEGSSSIVSASSVIAISRIGASSRVSARSEYGRSMVGAGRGGTLTCFKGAGLARTAEGSSSFGGAFLAPWSLRKVASNQASTTSEYASPAFSDEAEGAGVPRAAEQVLGGGAVVGKTDLTLATNSVWLTQSGAGGKEDAPDESTAGGEDVADWELLHT
ncbi:MAG TPA: hypothetical protein VKP30_06135 [Polyangiaceae bacterium]|nr:hypothetical protein [Polyangiaceae bacterium]